MLRKKNMTGWIAMAMVAIVTLMTVPGSAQIHTLQNRNLRWMQARAAQNRPQGHAGDWLRHYQRLPPGERERALQNDPGFRRLAPQQQQQLRQRLQHFSSLPPQEQQRMLNRMETWEHLTPGQKQEVRGLFGRMRQLPPERQRMVTTAVRDLRDMPAAQREQIIDSARFRGMFSPEEREIMRGAVRLPLAPPEGHEEPE